MKNNNSEKAAIDNKAGQKEPVSFFAKSGSPKGFKETIKLVLNLVINLFG